MSLLAAAPLLRRLRARLGPRQRLLDAVVATARARRVDAFLVGGPVRDLLLGRTVGDLDVLLSHGLGEVARDVAGALGGELALHPRFLTASVACAGLRLDLAQARSETYPTPGSLPVVEPSSVERDLLRRDFTIHALALPLDAQAGNTLLDPCEGRRDLAARRIRILHPRSFDDDPTRLLRASRYAARLGFTLEPGTTRALRLALRTRALGALSGDRIRHEVERLLDEADAARAAAHLDRAGLLVALAPGWRVGPSARAALRRLARAPARAPWRDLATPESVRAAGLRLLLSDIAPARAARAVAVLGLAGRPAEVIVTDLKALPALARVLARRLSDGALDARLAGAAPPLLLAAWCRSTPGAARRIERFSGELRRQRDPVRGDRLADLGARGPEIGALLRAARRRRLDGGDVDDAWLLAQLTRLRVVK